MTDVELRKHLTHLARKYGTEALLVAVSNSLVEGAAPGELGAGTTGYVPINRAVGLAIKMAMRFPGGLTNLRELAADGSLADATMLMCECVDSPQPLTGLQYDVLSGRSHSSKGDARARKLSRQERLRSWPSNSRASNGGFEPGFSSVDALQDALKAFCEE
jgi:hypothetical protein